jgi:hypothetical protein
MAAAKETENGGRKSAEILPSASCRRNGVKNAAGQLLPVQIRTCPFRGPSGTEKGQVPVSHECVKNAAGQLLPVCAGASSHTACKGPQGRTCLREKGQQLVAVGTEPAAVTEPAAGTESAVVT